MIEALWDVIRLGGIVCIVLFLFLVFVFVLVKISVIAFYSGKREATKYENEINKREIEQ